MCHEHIYILYIYIKTGMFLAKLAAGDKIVILMNEFRRIKLKTK